MPIAVPMPMPEPQHSSADALHVLIETLALTFQSHLQTILIQDDAESVHKARVTLRRFRTALAAFTPMIDEDLAEAMQYRARNVFRVLGEVRDADVMAVRFADTDRAAALAKNALTCRQKARKKLKKIRAESFSAWIIKRLESKTWRRTGKKGQGTARSLGWDPCGSGA